MKMIGNIFLGQKEDFTMVFAGSSLTAGSSYSARVDQSYPSVVQSKLTPVFAAMGLKLVVHNIAQGALFNTLFGTIFTCPALFAFLLHKSLSTAEKAGCLPYSLCFESMGGSNSDLLGWELEADCGREDAVSQISPIIEFERHPEP